MATKKDAGAASLKKVPTRLLREKIAEGLRILDEKVHLAKLEVNNAPYGDKWTGLDSVLLIASNVQATYREFRGRPDRRW
jgi:hypothetical protein